MKQLDVAIGNSTIVGDFNVFGPRGGQKTYIAILDDGRIVFETPDLHGNFPMWLLKYVPTKHVLLRRGGTTFRWSGWITEPAQFSVSYKYNGKKITKLFSDYGCADNFVRYKLKIAYIGISEIENILNLQ
jgi:hypothetical protein